MGLSPHGQWLISLVADSRRSSADFLVAGAKSDGYLYQLELYIKFQTIHPMSYLEVLPAFSNKCLVPMHSVRYRTIDDASADKS